ncbi:MAG: CHASE2 domain-containing protein, partial [Bacteroidota bacterium]
MTMDFLKKLLQNHPAWYIWIYASLVTLLTFLSNHWLVNLRIENAVYDIFQRSVAMDQRSHSRYAALSKTLDQMAFIGLDVSFFDAKTDQVKKEKLAQLLDRLGTIPRVQAIFLDYLFVADLQDSIISTTDQALIASMQSLGSRLVLPYLVGQKTPLGDLPFHNLDFTKRSTLLYEAKHQGYLASMPLPYDDVHRYVYPRSLDGQYFTAAYALLKAMPHVDEHAMVKDIPSPFEINFVLKGNQANDRRRPVFFAHASKVIDRLEKTTLEEHLAGKTLFIGLFDDHLDKFNQPIDRLSTPLSNETLGIYVAINTYLN